MKTNLLEAIINRYSSVNVNIAILKKSKNTIIVDVRDVIQNVVDQATDFANNTVNLSISNVEQICDYLQDTIKNTTDQGTDMLENVTNNAISSVQQISEDVHDVIRNVLNQGANCAKNTANKSISNVDEISKNVQNTPNQIVNETRKEVRDGIVLDASNVGDIANNVDTRVVHRVEKSGIDEVIDTSLKNFIRYFIRIWILLGGISSSIGIYGIYRDIPECLTFSVIFFYISIVVEIIIILEINFDSDIERKVFVLSELARIDWRSIVQDSKLMANSGFLIAIVLSFYFSSIIKRCQSVMTEN